MTFNPKDRFFKKAKAENFAARSVYKLEEIDKNFKIFKPGFKVLDLGCSPGSWSQYSSQKVGSQGQVIGIDLTKVELKLNNTLFFQDDILTIDWTKFCQDLGFSKFDLVISDMAPKTTGIKSTDQARSTELCQMAINIAETSLKTGGHFVCKLFHSSDFETIRDSMKILFKKFEALRPESTRTQSKEIFLIGLNKK